MLARVAVAFAFTGVLLAPAQTTLPTAAEAEKLEARLASNPDDLDSQSRLLNYYFRAGGAAADRIRPLRRAHILWLIEHHPGATVLGESFATIDPAGHALADPDGYKLAVDAWRKHFSGPPPSAAVFANAIHFLKTPDPAYARKLAAEGLAQYPKDTKIAGLEGTLDALAILGGKLLDNYGMITAFDDALAKSDAAAAARRELEATANPYVLSGAGLLFQRSQVSLMKNQRQFAIDETIALAERCFLRALEVDAGNL